MQNEDLLKLSNPSLGTANNPLDVSDIPPPEVIRGVRKKISEVNGVLKIARGTPTPLPPQAWAGKPGQPAPLPPPPTGMAAVVGGPARLRLSLSCQAFALLRTDIVAKLDSPKERWDRIVGLRLSFQKARTATGLLKDTTGENALRLAAALTAHNDDISTYVEAQLADKTVPLARRDSLGVRFSNQTLVSTSVAAQDEQRRLARERRQQRLYAQLAQEDTLNRTALISEELSGTLPTEDQILSDKPKKPPVKKPPVKKPGAKKPGVKKLPAKKPPTKKPGGVTLH